MSSVITMTFESHKDFTVDIDNIERVSPRGMELAFKAVQKQFIGMRGLNAKVLREAEDRDRKAAETEEAERVEKQLLFDAELASFTTEALKNAEERFAALPGEEKEAAVKSAAASSEVEQRREFLGGIEERIKTIRLANSEISPTDAAEQAIDEAENEADELNEAIGDAEAELKTLEAADETVAESTGEEGGNKPIPQ